MHWHEYDSESSDVEENDFYTRDMRHKKADKLKVGACFHPVLSSKKLSYYMP